ncbi:type II secretion system protein [Patescibacteria group bacterium]|nr:type II secretion system protein [Patescibacteria group bacterium]
MKEVGFTLMEILVYIAVLSIVIIAISSFLIWSIHSNTKAKVMRETLNNARRVMEMMTYEIKEAKSIYIPTSVFNSHPGQLSLETVKYLPEGEKNTYIDFYLCDTKLCFKKESQASFALTSDSVEIGNLVFSRVVSGETPSLQVDLKIDYKNPANRPEYQASVNLKSTVSLRNY